MPRTLPGQPTLPQVPGAVGIGTDSPALDANYGQLLQIALLSWGIEVMDRIEEQIEYGVIADRPDATGGGMLYYATDTKDFYIDDGATWTKLYRGYHIDGGRADSVYTVDQNVDGGTA